MLKKILVAMAMLYAAMSFAAVEVNKAKASDLDGVKGIGPTISAKILEERKKGDFKDWNDFIARVSGIGEGNAAKLSAAGLTVAGASYKGPAKADTSKTADKKDAKKDEKKVEKKEVQAVAAKPAASAPAKAASAPKK
jgi:competence protein ComEA